MKKYTSVLFAMFSLALFITLLSFGANSASASDCASGELFNSTTGQACTTNTVIAGCLAGYLFSSTTGQPCPAGNGYAGISGGATMAGTFNNLLSSYQANGGITATKALQQFLKDQGYYSGRIDGKYGAMSARAVSDFEADNDISESHSESNSNMGGGDRGGQAPHINAVAPSIISVGSNITITGKWLMTGKDRKDIDLPPTRTEIVVMLKNSQGNAAVLPLISPVDHNDNPTSSNLPLSANIPSTLCRYIEPVNYSCPTDSVFQVTPGTYTLYVQQNVPGSMATTNSNSVTLNITSTSSTPSITVLSPNGGESYTNIIPVRWTSQNIQGNVNLQFYFASRLLFTVPSVSNTGSKDVNLANYYTQSAYGNVGYVKICDTTGVCDMNNQPFTFTFTP